MSLVTTPKPVADQVITLEAGPSKKVQARFDRTTKSGWSLTVKPGVANQFKRQQKIAMLFASKDEIFSGDATVADINKDCHQIGLSVPGKLFTRPRRRHQRKNILLPTSVILMDIPDQFMAYTNEFIGRRNNVILNISRTGVLLGTAIALPESASQVMLLMGLNLDDPFNAKNQISMSGRIRRLGISTSQQRFPHGYGIEFNPTFPAFQNALDYFVEELVDERVAANNQAV